MTYNMGLVLTVFVLLFSGMLMSCATETLEIIDPKEATLVGKWRHINSRSWGTLGDGFDFVTDYNTNDTVIMELIKGNFKLYNDQLTYRNKTYTISVKNDTLSMSQPRYLETYLRWK